MSQDQIRQFAVLVREFRLSKAENVLCKAEVDVAVENARRQLATARELLARLDAILNPGNRSSR